MEFKKTIETAEKPPVTLNDVMPKFRGNQSEAAIYFTCNRATIRKYPQDKKGDTHEIVVRNGQLRIFTDTGRAE